MHSASSLIVALASLTLFGSLFAFAQPAGDPSPTTAPITTPSGLIIIDQGRLELQAQANDFVTVHYTGKLDDGTVFDTSLKPGASPFVMQVGVTKVIQGWQEGIVGMKVGDRRRLTIPGNLGYGARGSPPIIPPNATLTFDIVMLYIDRPAMDR